MEGPSSSASRGDRTMGIETRPNPFKVGDILHDSWGWDQTNNDFYQVIAVTARSVLVRHIKSEHVDRSPDGYAGHVVPLPGRFYGEEGEDRQVRDTSGRLERPYRKVVRFFEDGRPHINTHDGRSLASLWDGTPKYDSCYA